MQIPGVEIRTVDYKGRVYDRFFVDRVTVTGTGWFIVGRNAEYNDRLRMVAAWPDKPMRKTKYYNGKHRLGWTRKRDAQTIADKMNSHV